MKSLKYILAMAAMSLFTVACVQETPYEKGEPDLDGCYGVYFPVQEAAGSHTFDPSMPAEVEFIVARTKSTGAITVPIEYKESHDGIFQVPAAVFADGQTETTIKVAFPTSENGVNYSLSLAINDPQYASKYNDGATNIDFSVLRVEWKYFLNPQTNEPAVFTFNQDWWAEVHTGKVMYYEVNGVRTCKTVTDPVETEDGTAYGFWGTGEAEGDGEITFTWYTKVIDGNGKQAVLLPETPVYFHPSYNAVVHAYDWYTYFTVANPQAALQGVDFPTFVAEYGANYPTSYYDNGGFYFFISYYYMIGIGGWGIEDYDVVCEAEGFTRVDYSLAAATDYTQNGVAPVQFTAGADIAKINYVTVAGKVNSVAMEELLPTIADGSAENLQTINAADMTEDEGSKTATFGLTFPATGEYTLVAVGLDAEGNSQNSTSIVIDYIAADDATYDVAFEVFAENTPARYAAEGLTEYNSFAYTIYGGNGISEAHIAIFDAATVEAAGMDAVVAEVRNDKYAVDTTGIAAINSIAGYSDIVSGLKDGVTYAVVVWATNGKQTKTSIAEFATTKNPEVFKSLGTGLYTEDFLAGLFDGMENLTYEVEIEESVDNPGKYRLVNPYGAAFPYNEPGDYDDTQDYYLVIHAEDPDGVYIPLQGVGCDWGYGEWQCYSYAAYYMDNGYSLEEVKAAGKCGTLKDGIITFPESGLLITAPGLGGSIYKANTYGAFKVVLPEAVETTTAQTASPASVSTASISAESAFEASMTAGYSTGIDYSDKVFTVACKVVPSVSFEKAGRNSAIRKYSVSLN